MLLIGLIALAAAMTGAVYLITDFLFAPGTAVAIAVAGAVSFGWLWFGQALARRVRQST